MKNIPNKIWLTTGLDNDEEVRDFKELSEVSWCEDKVNDKDIPYRRVRRFNWLALCSWIFAIVTIPLVYLLYLPYIVLKTLVDIDEFENFYRTVLKYLFIPIKVFYKQKK